MKNSIESWSYFIINGQPTHKVYTEDKTIRNEILKIKGSKQSAIYKNNFQQVIGWDMIILSSKMDFIKRQFGH